MAVVRPPVHEDPERFVRVVLAAFQDGTVEVFRVAARVDLTLALLLIVGSMGLLAATLESCQCIGAGDGGGSGGSGGSADGDADDTVIANAFGDRDVRCGNAAASHRGSGGGWPCYRRIDGTTGRTLYVRDASGVHFEMSDGCSRGAPEDDQLRCKREWSIVDGASLSFVWYFRLYENSTATRLRDDGRYSFVATATRYAVDDVHVDKQKKEEEDEETMAALHAPVVRAVFRGDRVNWIVSANGLPRDRHPEADVFFDVPVTFEKLHVMDRGASAHD